MTIKEWHFVKCTTSWRFIAFGYHDYRTALDRHVRCIGLGPWRLHWVRLGLADRMREALR